MGYTENIFGLSHLKKNENIRQKDENPSNEEMKNLLNQTSQNETKDKIVDDESEDVLIDVKDLDEDLSDDDDLDLDDLNDLDIEDGEISSDYDGLEDDEDDAELEAAIAKELAKKN